MLALIQKIDAADAAHFAKLQEIAKKESDARARTLERRLANLRSARARIAEDNNRRTPVQSCDDGPG